MKDKKLSQHQRFQNGLKPYKNKLLVLVLLVMFFSIISLGRLKRTDNYYVSEDKEVLSHIACPYESLHYKTEIKRPELSTKASAVIVPHHLLAGQLINSTLSNIDPNYETIILVGPNHRGIGIPSIQTSSYIWKTIFGEISPNIELINTVANNNQISILEDYFDSEHSMCGLATFVKKYFPKAKIVPIMLRNDVSQDNIKKLAKELSSECKNCLVIASVDFSHEVSEREATENDTNSIKLLREKQMDYVDAVISDCNQCIAFLYGFLEKDDNLFLVDNDNSYNLSGESKDSVTSYVAGYYSEDLLNLLFTGDFMFDRFIRETAEAKGNNFVLENIGGYLNDKDLVITNLEGPITDYKSVSVNTKVGEKNNYKFTFDPSVTKTLIDHNISVVNIGNNHMLDFGQEGLVQTIKYLRRNNVNFFGNTGTKLDYPENTILSQNGVNLGFVNYNQFVEDGLEQALNDLTEVREKSDFVFLYTHWGNEYVKHIDKSIQKLAHQFIDNGADVIIGSHPHVVQESEIYKDKPIYYSLGNFVFDQYFSDDTKTGLVVEVLIDPATKKTNFIEKYVILTESGQTHLKQ